MNLGQLAKLIDRPAELAPLPATTGYPQRVLVRESLKSGAGVLICVAMLVLLRPTPWIGWPLAGVASLFGAYLLQQLRRVNVDFTVDEAGVTRVRGGQRQVLRWAELIDLRLNFYPNGRKASTGTLMVVLRNARGRMKADSALEHFPTLLARAAQAARDRGLVLHPTTQENLTKLGL